MIIFGLLAVRGAIGQAPSRFEFVEVHMGMPVRLVLYAADEGAARNAAAAAFARISGLDATLSDYRPDSELNRLSGTSGQWVPVSDALFAVLVRAERVSRDTDGVFDVTVGPLVALWREARGAGRLPDAEVLAEARQKVGWRLVELDHEARTVRLARAGMALDLGGIAKGFVLQEALAVLRAQGIGRALLAAGGDVVVGEAPPGRPGWRIDVPGAGQEFAARAARLVNSALATSGSSMQFVDIGGIRYSHVLDPATGVGLTHRETAHVIAPDGAMADALATALGVIGRARAPAILRAFPDAVAHLVPGGSTASTSKVRRR